MGYFLTLNQIINFINHKSFIYRNFSSKTMYTYKILLHKEVEGGYTVTVPALPGCITYGQDVDEAISMAKEAIEIYIEELKDRGESIPVN